MKTINICAVIMVAFLASCSGGSGGSNPKTNPPPEPLALQSVLKDCGTNHKFFDVANLNKTGHVMYYGVLIPFKVKDPANFQCTDTAYASDGIDVYFGRDRIEGADPSTFSLLGKVYAKDKHIAYYRHERIPVGDIASFQLMQNDTYYAKDKDSYYYRGSIIFPRDPATFVPMGQNVAKDNMYIYTFGRIEDAPNKINRTLFRHLGGGFYTDNSLVYYIPDGAGGGQTISIVSDADPATATTFGYDYLMDAQNIYYKRYIVTAAASNVELLDEDYLVVDGSIYITDVLIENANPDTFKTLFQYYATDGANVYFSNVLLGTIDTSNLVIRDGGYLFTPNFISTPWGPKAGVDVATAEYIGDGYYKDANAVWRYQTEFTGADPSTFSYLGHFNNSTYTKDSTNVYANQVIQAQYDASSFQILSSYFFRDQSGIYCNNNLLTNADAASFIVLNDVYAKDNARVYHGCTEIATADTATFGALNELYAKDDTTVFYASQVVVDADAATFVALNTRYGSDGQSVYYGSTLVQGADPGSFRLLLRSSSVGGAYLNIDWAMDDSNTYKNAQSIVGVNLVESQLRLIGSEWIADNDTILLNNTETPLVGFRRLSNSYLVNNGEVLWYDFTWGASVIPGADGDTFSVLARNIGKDDTNVYESSTIVPNLTPSETKIAVAHLYDSDTLVYTASAVNIEVTGVDIATLQFLTHEWDTYYQDATNVYWRGQIVVGADVASFELFNPRLNIGRDAGWIYQDGIQTTAR